MRNYHRIVFLLLLILFLSVQADAAVCTDGSTATTCRYVVSGSSGGDGTTIGTSGSTAAYSNPQTCLNAAQPGWVCLVRAGTYTQTSGAAAYYFVTSGTAANPIILRGYAVDAKPLLQSNTTFGSERPAALAWRGREYSQVDGISVRPAFDVNSPQNETGSPNCVSATGTTHCGTRGVVIKNSECTTGRWSDNNWSCLWLAHSDGAVIEYNNFHDITPTAGSGSCFAQMFSSSYATLQYNTASSCAASLGGIGDKASSRYNIHRYNSIANGIFLSNQGSSEGTVVYGNVFYGGGNGVKVNQNLISASVYNNTIVNNTYEGISKESEDSGSSGILTAYNNIIMGAGTGNWLVYGPASFAGAGTNYNIYTSGESYVISGASGTFASWKSTTGRDANSIEASSCSWISTTLGNANYYKPTGSTTCDMAGVGGVKVGAYGVTSCVGHTCAKSGAETLSFSTQPGNGTGGSNLATQPVVTKSGADDDTTVVTLSIGTNPGGGVLTCTDTTVQMTNNVATFSGCKITTAGTGYTFTATASGVTGATSSTFDITVGSAAKLGFTQNPGGGSATVVWTQQPIVAVQDAGGNTVTSATNSITLAIGTNPGSGTLSGGTNPLSASSGLATFAGQKINNSGVGYTLTAAASGLTGATSNAFNINSSPLPPATCDDAINLDANILFCDDFEASAPSTGINRYFDLQAVDSGSTFTRVAGVGYNGSYGMQTHLTDPCGAPQCSAGGVWLKVGANPDTVATVTGVGGTTVYTHLYWRIYVKFASNWVDSDSKFARLTTFTNATAYNWRQASVVHWWEDPSHRLYIDPATCVGNSTAGDNVASTNVLCTSWNQFGTFAFLGGDTQTGTFSSGHAGVWQCVEGDMTLNTVGQADGSSNLWIDGVLVAHKGSLNLRSSYATYGINAISLMETYLNSGATATQDRYWDNIIVSTAPIGCLEDAVEPSAPSGFRAVKRQFGVGGM